MALLGPYGKLISLNSQQIYYSTYNRSWVGANSGVITYRTTKMYEQKEEQITYVKVHTVPGMFDYINFEVEF